MNPRLEALADGGVSVWLDDLSRRRMRSGNLEELIGRFGISGVTTNPTIFAAALADGADYAEPLAGLAGMGTAGIIKLLCAADVREACDLFKEAFNASRGFDGRVSIEVEPGLAHDAQATIAQAAELYELVGRENVLIKIPATDAGLPAIEATIASGISVNATLIFSVERYRQVMEAYLAGLEAASAAGRDLRGIHSVASVFVSRIDAEVDQRLAFLGRPEMKGRAAVANAIVAYAEYQRVFGTARFRQMAELGANVQRPLWASTGTKDPAYPDTKYVSELVAGGVVNTMPEKTLLAFADHGSISQPIAGRGSEGRAVLDELNAAGVDLDDVFAKLESEGVSKFLASWEELVISVRSARAALA